jgi:hypothetical protein
MELKVNLPTSRIASPGIIDIASISRRERTGLLIGKKVLIGMRKIKSGPITPFLKLTNRDNI